MEVIDLGFDNLEPISIEEKTVNTTPSVNFGPGVELLMNDKNNASAKEEVNLK